jgi:hypothetical protein
MPGFISGPDDWAVDTLFHVERPPLTREVFAVSRNHPETSHEMAAKAAPRSGTLRATIYDLIADRGHLGLTCDEAEQILNRSHQSVSATFNSLKNDEWIVDSGERRLTRYANRAIVWVIRKDNQ